MITFSNISFTIESRAIFSGISFSIPRNGRVVIKGKSGSGKSTLLKMILAFVAPTTGNVTVDNMVVSDQTAFEIRKKIAWLPQTPHPFPGETLFSFVTRPLFYQANRRLFDSHEQIAERVAALLNATDLSHVDPHNKEAASLSGGELQRAALIRALLLQRPILLLDETTAALDSKSSDIIIQKIKKMEKITVVAVAHDTLWEKNGFIPLYPFGEPHARNT